MRWCNISILLYASTAYAASACNGNIKLCDRVYSNITQIGAHDSAFVGVSPADNEALPVPDQLDAGIRFLQAQTHLNALNVLELCHTSCYLLDAGSVESYLQTIKTWLDANPNQVVTLLLTNGDRVPINLFGNAMDTSGLSSYAFAPGKDLALDEWPTLQELIDGGHRLVMFLDYGADTSVVPFILDEFKYFFETPFDTTDPNFPQCTIDRPPGASADGRMSIMNHFLDLDLFGILIPDDPADSMTNSAASIEAQASLCSGAYDRAPNGILVDYFNIGNVFAAQDFLNGL